MDFLHTVATALLGVVSDVLPIVVIIFGFQFLVLRKKPPRLRRTLVGFVYVLLGLAVFLVGLEEALFPLGETMAQQLSSPDFLGGIAAASGGEPSATGWERYLWVYAFAAAIGFATTVAEPALIAVALKAHAVSGGAVGVWGLRIAVALGVAVGVALGAYRIVAGLPLHYFIMGAYVVVLIQTVLVQRKFATRSIVPLAYDSGGVTTSTVTVPLVAALGLGLASAIPGRSPLIDGFGLIAFASVFPIMSVLVYAELGTYWSERARARRGAKAETNEGGAS